jgi:hypothetical protein
MHKADIQLTHRRAMADDYGLDDTISQTHDIMHRDFLTQCPY